MKTAQKSAIDANDPLTFEKVWKMFQETKAQIEASGRTPGTFFRPLLVFGILQAF